MANVIYQGGKRRFLQELLTGVVKVSLIDSASYTPDTAADTFYADIPPAAVVAEATLTGITVTGDGVFDADDTTLLAVTGPQSEYLVIWIDTGVAGTSPLLAFYDTFAAGMPVTPGGGNIVIQWDNGVNRIFKL